MKKQTNKQKVGVGADNSLNSKFTFDFFLIIDDQMVIQPMTEYDQ